MATHLDRELQNAVKSAGSAVHHAEQRFVATYYPLDANQSQQLEELQKSEDSHCTALGAALSIRL